MIPVLLPKNELKLTSFGIGPLPDAVKASVTEERNGKYELSLQYPVTGERFEEISEGSVVRVKANHTSSDQCFRIYKSSKPINGVVTYSAQHISYDLCGFPLAGFTAEDLNPQQAIRKALSESPLGQWFNAYSDISTVNSTAILGPCSVRALLGGMRGSILDVWGGEYEFNNRAIHLHASRGADNGVTILYGKNMTSLIQDADASETYTHLFPYASYKREDDQDGDPVYVYLPEKVLALGNEGQYYTGAQRALIMDFSDKFGENNTPRISTLRNFANAYISGPGSGLIYPKVSIKVSFVPLWQTEEYKNIAPLETVSLCDTVTVKYQKLGVNAKTKVVQTVFNALTERYESITLGSIKPNLAAKLADQFSSLGRMQTELIRPICEFEEP